MLKMYFFFEVIDAIRYALWITMTGSRGRIQLDRPGAYHDLSSSEARETYVLAEGAGDSYRVRIGHSD